MKRILATTALVALTAMPSFAQTDTTTTTGDTTMSQADPMGGMFDMNGLQISADEMIGRTIYGSSVAGAGTGDAVITGDGTAADGTMTESGVAGMDAPADDWENLGSVNDVIFSADGGIDAVVLDIGGFLGIGAREISLTMDELTLINDTSSDEDFFVVYNGNPAELEQRPEMDRDSMTLQGSIFQSEGGTNTVTDDAEMQDTMTTATDSSDAPLAPTTAQDASPATGANDLVQEGAQAPLVAEEITTTDPAGDAMAMEDDTYLSDEDRAALTADDLIGADVHDLNGETVGNIDDIVLTADGQLGEVIVDVGGFLGIGARPVALAFDDLQIARDEGGMTSSLRVSTQLTEEELENMPEWTGDS
ncbi:PRC-barrel domain-containing protein [Yoonia vestfoldensis]|uniref:PRC-barrel domain-containing protein n=1 Tax=Yoonia vestfoldensis TaxID=245188 RepID=UPI00037AF76D|nr:PRC-barrel domain-containing protein [Yoonia vestfoldensis]